MIIVGEKINGAIPVVKKAIAERNEKPILRRIRMQEEAGADYLDVAASTSPEEEYDAFVWLLDVIQKNTELPLCIDSPNPKLLRRILEEGLVKKPGLVNSVSMEGEKCDILFPVIAGTEWGVVGLTCDNIGIPSDAEKKFEIAKEIIDRADKAGIPRSKVFIDPCVMALSTMPTAMKDFEESIQKILAYAPEVHMIGAISNISFEMPARKYVNMGCMAYAIAAGLDSAIVDPCNEDMMGLIYAAEALSMKDKGGRKYNRAYRQGKFGKKDETK